MRTRFSGVHIAKVLLGPSSRRDTPLPSLPSSCARHTAIGVNILRACSRLKERSDHRRQSSSDRVAVLVCIVVGGDSTIG